MSIAARRVSRGAIPFYVQPQHVAGLSMWLQADAITGVSDGAKISLWPDSSGLGMHASNSSSANQPTFIMNATKGKPVVRFNGSTTSLVSAASASFPEQTFFIVCRPRVSLTGIQTFRGASAPNGGLQIRMVDGRMHLIKQNINGVGYSYALPTLDWFQVMVCTFSAGNSYSFWFDGTTEGSLPTTETLTANTTTVIGKHGTGTEYFNGDIAEICYYNRVLTSQEIADVSAGLKQKWIPDLQPSTLFWQDAPASVVGTTATASNIAQGSPDTTPIVALQNWLVTWSDIYGDSQVSVITDPIKGKVIQFLGNPNGSADRGGYLSQRAEQVPIYRLLINREVWIGFDVWLNADLGNSTSWQGIFQIKTPNTGSPNVAIGANASNNGYPGCLAIGSAQGPPGVPNLYHSLGVSPLGSWTRIVVGVYITTSDSTSWVEVWRDGSNVLTRRNWRSYDQASTGKVGGIIYDGFSTAYLKFGAYRGPASWPIDVRMANFKIATDRSLVL